MPLKDPSVTPCSSAGNNPPGDREKDLMFLKHAWTLTLIASTLAVAFAATGLVSATFYPGVAPAFTSGLMLASLGSTAAAFGLVAVRVRRLELENEGLVEELSQEFDRVKDKLEIFGEALAEPRTLEPEEAEAAPLRRVTIR